ncbi:hypothetical protein KQI42_06300 [Tissierella sp. MSJ-40]|uniref:Uncharacterized protein n=1 Tax=Tissierella simiarum TaxID=2841534 RepID=A0ABS6E3X4_9FIRM|nr:hypothetical protein [Tissierella simiarum]MBU5437609.1 hypothetical protein [Tissierella simiarum]
MVNSYGKGKKFDSIKISEIKTENESFDTGHPFYIKKDTINYKDINDSNKNKSKIFTKCCKK